uniref:Deacetylase sirtuin-type domain-containing protein n=1 Tax=Sexangularia sp. CB-2014 TaxID=1486929 RepID=A0A7S1VG89_9EUKA
MQNVRDCSAEMLVRLLATSTKTLVLTGAGISAEAGLSTFRGTGARWQGVDPASLATPRAFASTPDLAWSFYQGRRAKLAQAAPTIAHGLLRGLWSPLPVLGGGDSAADEACRVAFAWRCRQTRVRPISIVTQNVDGLHGPATDGADAVGAVSRGDPVLLQLHGALAWDRCSSATCGHRQPASSDEAAPLRTCPSCHRAPLRPDVVWFGESLDSRVLDAAEAVAREADLVLIIGTSGVVYPAAGLSAIAKRSGTPAVSVEINPDGGGGDYVVRRPASEFLAEVVAVMRAAR